MDSGFISTLLFFNVELSFWILLFSIQLLHDIRTEEQSIHSFDLSLIKQKEWGN